MKLIRLSLTIFACLCSITAFSESIDLSGLWRFQLDPMGFGKTPGSELYLSKLTESIVLPGSMDESGKGIPNAVSHVDRLSRKFEYCGQAWYQREVEIPESWQGKEIILTLERCHWETSVYVDGVPAGTDERLSTPNRFILTKQLTPGLHTLTICVDNRLKYPMDQWAHGTTEYTQTNWNGIVGDMKLEAKPAYYLANVQVEPDIQQKNVRVRCAFHTGGKNGQGNLTLTVKDQTGKKVAESTTPVTFQGKEDGVEQTLSLGKRIALWDEFSPALYTLDVSLSTNAGQDSRSLRFGMRKVEQGKHHIRLNDRDIHLRGVLDCAVFPLTGYPSTNPDDWRRIMDTIKEYGFNHVRFHSWCPPEAAFTAADELGLYLQVELPMWIKDVGKYPARRDFFEQEMYAILNEYGNHPSFLLFCNGNENEGDFAVLEDLIQKGQAYDDRHLYAASTARTHVKSDQYYTSHVTQKGWITVYEGKPGTDWDRNETSDIDVPVIAHETGQRCMYPNFQEITKYTGVLEARNFKVFQERLTKNGMLHQADEFFRATGAHTVLQYKEVNEALLRTSKSGGFQLLGLSDFPGQGSAFVGILDAFWESKGLVSPEKYRESCAPVVLLARFPKRIYTEKETFSPRMEIYQFGEKDLKPGKMNWKLTDEGGHVIVQGKLTYYADWQWWDILNYAGAIDLTALTGLTPIIQSVDTYEVNRKLGIAFEAQVGKGKLFFLNLDLSKKMDERPATNQLLRSISQYVRSTDFQPSTTIPLYQLDALFAPDVTKGKQTQGNAAIQQLLNQ